MILTNFLELLRFAAVGAVNTVTTLAVMYILMSLRVNLYLANLVGYLAGLVVSFTLNRRWTFRSAESVGPRLIGSFVLAVCLAYCSNMLAVMLCVRADVSPYVSQLVGMSVYTICFYLLSKWFVFRKTGGNSRNLEVMVRK